MSSPDRSAERGLLYLLAAIQFVNILEFMMVMPLGPDIAKALDFSVSHIGTVGGTYTAAAALSGLVCSLFLERFDRRLALGVAMTGLVLSTGAAAFATSLGTLLGTRILAGVFGGPASSLAIAIVADRIPPERRGRAMGVVMGAFPAASVLGVPVVLEVARFGDWRWPFFFVAGLGALIVALAVFWLPPVREHLDQPSPDGRASTLMELARRPQALAAWAAGGLMMGSGFMLFPNIATYVQRNLGYPRGELGFLYFVGGIATFVGLRFIGRAVDRFGATRVGTFGAMLMSGLCWLWFIGPGGALPVVLMFALFMVASNVRSMPYMTLASKVPRLHERARFMSIQAAVHHVSSAMGAFFASQMLVEAADGRLAGMDHIAWVSVALMAGPPGLLWFIERKV